MSQTFKCPNCGAVNEYSGEGDTVRCAYCGNTIHPPAEMVNKAEMRRLGTKAKPWIILFIVVVVVIPLCGTLIGIGASLLGALAAVVAPFIGH